MAFVPGYKHDLFVSYANVDNERGWVTVLVRELRIQLAAWIGRSDAFEIWWDRTGLDETGSLPASPVAGRSNHPLGHGHTVDCFYSEILS